MAGFKARFAKSLDDVVSVLNLNLRDLEKSSLGGTKTILKGSSDSAPKSILIPNPVASVVNTEHDLLQGLNEGGYLHLVPALHAYVESLQSREDAASGFAMLNASRLVPVERLPLGDILAPHLSAVNPHIQYILGTQKGVAGGVCDLDSQAMVPIERIPVGLLGGLTPKGVWDPATNTPTLANPAPAATRGWFYIASGSSEGSLGKEWKSGDWAISDGSVWQKIDNTDKVASVFGRTGAVTAQSGDYNLDQVSDGTTYKRVTATEKSQYDAAYTHSQSAHAPANANNTQSALNAAASKTTPVDADMLAMLDSAASNSINRVTWANVKATLKAYLDGVYEPKLTAGDTAKYYRGDKTWQDLAGAVRSTVLTGLASGTNAAIAATDTVLGGLAKLQAQLNSKQNALTFDSAPTASSSNPVTSGGVYTALAGKASNAYYNDDGAGKLTISSGSSSKNIEFRNGSVVFAFSGIEALPLFYVNTPPLAATANETPNVAWVRAHVQNTKMGQGYLSDGNFTLPAGAPIGYRILVTGTNHNYDGSYSGYVYRSSDAYIIDSGHLFPGYDSISIQGAAYRGKWFTRLDAGRWLVEDVDPI